MPLAGYHVPSQQAQPMLLNPNGTLSLLNLQNPDPSNLSLLAAQYGMPANLSPKVPTRVPQQQAGDSDLALAMKLQQQFDEEARSGTGKANKESAKSGSGYPGSRPAVTRGADTSRDEELARALQEEENQKSEESE
jgi:hypothetical protein